MFPCIPSRIHCFCWIFRMNFISLAFLKILLSCLINRYSRAFSLINYHFFLINWFHLNTIVDYKFISPFIHNYLLYSLFLSFGNYSICFFQHFHQFIISEIIMLRRFKRDCSTYMLLQNKVSINKLTYIILMQLTGSQA